MPDPSEVLTEYFLLLRRFGLPESEIAELHGEPIENGEDGLAVLEDRIDVEARETDTLYDWLTATLAASERGIEIPKDADLDGVEAALSPVFERYGIEPTVEPADDGARVELTESATGETRSFTYEFPAHSLDDRNYPALMDAIERELLADTEMCFVLLTDDEGRDVWQFVVLGDRRLDALRRHHDDQVSFRDLPILHDHQPATYAEPEPEAMVEEDADEDDEEGPDWLVGEETSFEEVGFEPATPEQRDRDSPSTEEPVHGEVEAAFASMESEAGEVAGAEGAETVVAGGGGAVTSGRSSSTVTDQGPITPGEDVATAVRQLRVAPGRDPTPAVTRLATAPADDPDPAVRSFGVSPHPDPRPAVRRLETAPGEDPSPAVSRVGATPSVAPGSDPEPAVRPLEDGVQSPTPHVEATTGPSVAPAADPEPAVVARTEPRIVPGSDPVPAVRPAGTGADRPSEGGTVGEQRADRPRISPGEDPTPAVTPLSGDDEGLGLVGWVRDLF